MSGHLKGWRVSAGDEHTVFDGSGVRLVSVPCGGLSGRTFDEAADAARLIAAAPDLLEALAAVVVTFKRGNPMRTADIHDPGCTCMRCAIDFADAAIAEATGGDA